MLREIHDGGRLFTPSTMTTQVAAVACYTVHCVNARRIRTIKMRPADEWHGQGEGSERESGEGDEHSEAHLLDGFESRGVGVVKGSDAATWLLQTFPTVECPNLDTATNTSPSTDPALPRTDSHMQVQLSNRLRSVRGCRAELSTAPTLQSRQAAPTIKHGVKHTNFTCGAAVRSHVRVLPTQNAASFQAVNGIAHHSVYCYHGGLASLSGCNKRHCQEGYILGPSSNMNKLYGTVNYTARGVNKYAWVPLV